ncbi:MAG: CO dehydrogenase/acetyl-CoA synthase complex subunit epsilon [Theionarchaea archaeon]|nr:CO dehydrogenase/acetyl-CoA synthase complex subunit epsilon [Theionarchaea archaeon]MBU7041320.1 CO dehydrogenase/acetyl-CoA synthase complex subunit epsilon [Theionarchaea archaeon]
MAKPYFPGNVPGIKMAMAVTPEQAAKIIKKAERRILVAGAQLEEVEQAINLADGAIVAAPDTVRQFKEKGASPVVMNKVSITNLLRDASSWKGLDGKGSYDLAIYMGSPYYFESQMLSCLKHFSSCKTIAVSRFYQPNATYSFDNLSEKKWKEALTDLVKFVEE